MGTVIVCMEVKGYNKNPLIIFTDNFYQQVLFYQETVAQNLESKKDLFSPKRPFTFIFLMSKRTHN